MKQTIKSVILCTTIFVVCTVSSGIIGKGASNLKEKKRREECC
jgi:hypothetical protein